MKKTLAGLAVLASLIVFAMIFPQKNTSKNEEERAVKKAPSQIVLPGSLKAEAQTPTSPRAQESAPSPLIRLPMSLQRILF